MSVENVRYRDLLARLYDSRRHGVKLSLGRVECALGRLGHPEKNLPTVVQVAGTNGKGSTAAILAALLEAGGVRTGLFTSPHLSRFSERFMVDGTEVDSGGIVAAGGRVADVDADGTLTFFEQLTLMAVCLFEERAVDVAILEVGLGGRFDATTAVGADLALVTGVAMDHEEYLGSTLEEIAAEKGAIFRRGRPAVIGCSGEVSGSLHLAAQARAAGAGPIAVIGEAHVSRVSPAIGLVGSHQRANAAAALAALELLAVRGVSVSQSAVARGLAGVRVPGRLEWIDGVLFDGAHNPHAARALAGFVADLPQPRNVVLGLCRGKDAAGIVSALLPVADGFWVTNSRSPRSLPAAELSSVVSSAGGRVVGEIPDVAGAVCQAQMASHGGTLVVTGSLYVVGEGRSALLGRPGDDLGLSDPL